jgi:PAS domain S-box-containing protein
MGDGIKVIYVDDEPDLLEIARLFLEEAGDFQVTTLPSAITALDSPQILSYDAIISDYQMPEMDGITFLKEVRHRFGDIPFILFTGRGREEVVIEAINNGADFYIQKGGSLTPQFAELAHKIRQAVFRKRSEISRIKAERELRESEEKYRTLVDLAPVAVLVHRDGTIVYANPECVRLAGAKSAGDLTGREILPLIHPDDRPIMQKHLRQISMGATIPLTEIRLFTLDGRPFTVESAGKPVLYGGFPSVIIVYRDITDQKRARDELSTAYEQLTASENELRSQYRELAVAQHKLWESRQQLSEIANSVPGIVYQYYVRPDNSRGISFISSRAPEVIGIVHEPDRFLERFLARVDPRDQQAYLDSIEEAVTSESPWDFEGRLVKPTGETIWFQGVSRPLRKGSDLVYNGVIFDITARKRAEESLRESERKFRTIFEKSHDAFLMFTDGAFTDCNQYALDLFGFSSRDEIIGIRPWDLSPEKQPDGQDSMAAAGAHIRAAMEQGSNQFAWTHTRKDGSTFTADILLSALEISGRQVIFTSIRDITGRILVENTLRESY